MAVAIAVVIAAPRASLLELTAALFGLAAALAVAGNFLAQVGFGFVDARGALVVPVARMSKRGTAEQQESAERHREQRGSS